MTIQNGLETEDLRILDILKNKRSIILLNKIDEKNEGLENDINIKQTNKPVIKISAKTKEGIEDLYEQILKMFKLNEIEINDGEVITNIRHKNQIRKAIDALKQAKQGLKIEIPIDIIAVSLKESIEDLSEITGENVSEDIINNIFSKFCLGK
ncbi:tRNA modification GTPase MnmE [Clostridium sp. CAG:567]|nr:tRNA modification GTPase MnmE [Clostridium sp. CAG:567]